MNNYRKMVDYMNKIIFVPIAILSLLILMLVSVVPLALIFISSFILGKKVLLDTLGIDIELFSKDNDNE